MMRREDKYRIVKDKDKNRSKLDQMGINKLQKLAGALRETGETGTQGTHRTQGEKWTQG